MGRRHAAIGISGQYAQSNTYINSGENDKLEYKVYTWPLDNVSFFDNLTPSKPQVFFCSLFEYSLLLQKHLQGLPKQIRHLVGGLLIAPIRLKGKSMFGASKPLLRAIALGVTAVGVFGLGSGKTTRDALKSLGELVKYNLNNPKIRVAQTPGNAGGEANRLDANPFVSNTTYHTYSWDYCQEWEDGQQERCRQWLDPYVSDHGFGGQKSPLEGAVAQAYLGMRQNKSDSEWAIWNVQTKAGEQVARPDGRLNRSGLAKFELKDEVKKELDKVGVEASQDLMVGMVRKNESKETMPNMESLRASAASLTLAFRNNLVGLLGGLWRMQPGVEMPIGESFTGCDVLTGQGDDIEANEKLDPQAKLNLLTQGKEREERVQLCRQLMSQSVRTVNPRVQGDQVVSGNPDEEAIDQWKIRANIELMDDLQKSINDIAKPADANVTEEEVSSQIVLSDNGDDKIGYELAKDQIEGYNKMLEKAAAAQSDVSQATQGQIPDMSQNIKSYQIKGSVSAVEVNGLTPEMKQYLAEEKVETVQAVTPEMTPQELLQTASQ